MANNRRASNLMIAAQFMAVAATVGLFVAVVTRKPIENNVTPPNGAASQAKNQSPVLTK